MRKRALLLALPVLVLPLGCGDDDGVAETEATTTSTTEGGSTGTTFEAADPADDAVAGRTACTAIPDEGEGDDPEALQAIADEAPQDVATALEDVIGARDDPSALDEATAALAEVCRHYGVDLG